MEKKKGSIINSTAIPATNNGMFEKIFIVRPDDRFSLEDMKVLINLLQIQIKPEQFDTLPEHFKEQCVVFDRTGSEFRYKKTNK